jgi:pyruvate/2-oxoglutarate dehydrogenase complex dihydrolipoamide acyltransferase (E2) component
VKFGDKVKQGSVVLVLEGEGASAARTNGMRQPRTSARCRQQSPHPWLLRQHQPQSAFARLGRSCDVRCASFWAVALAVTRPPSVQQTWV